MAGALFFFSLFGCRPKHRGFSPRRMEKKEGAKANILLPFFFLSFPFYYIPLSVPLEVERKFAALGGYALPLLFFFFFFFLSLFVRIGPMHRGCGSRLNFSSLFFFFLFLLLPRRLSCASCFFPRVGDFLRWLISFLFLFFPLFFFSPSTVLLGQLSPLEMLKENDRQRQTAISSSISFSFFFLLSFIPH